MILFIYCARMRVCLMHVWRSEDNSLGLDLSFHHVGLGADQVVSNDS